MKRVYFDHAATSWPRLSGVADAMYLFENAESASAGRGSYSSTTAITARISQLRLAIARMVNASAREVAFFANGTSANNYALAGVLRSGDHVVTTDAEHNSILRPLRLLEQQRGITWTPVKVDASGAVDPSDIAATIRPETKLIVCTSASNVTGSINDLAAIGAIASNKRILFMVDAAQSLGYDPIDMHAMRIDIMAAPGHKGAGGPLGTGVLIVDASLHADWQPLWIGGTGEMSDQLDGDFDWTQIAESGNRNATALVGWLAGIEHLTQLPDGNLVSRQRRLHELLDGCSIGRLIGHAPGQKTVPVFSLDCSTANGSGLSPGDWSALLDSAFHIEVRSGLHCAARVHQHLNTVTAGGTLRFSIGHTTTDEDLDTLESVLKELRAWKN
jgi:selenocysteine lyase/cysteine desulfurase